MQTLFRPCRIPLEPLLYNIEAGLVVAFSRWRPNSPQFGSSRMLLCIPSVWKEAKTRTRLPLNVVLFLTSSAMVASIGLSGRSFSS